MHLSAGRDLTTWQPQLGGSRLNLARLAWNSNPLVYINPPGPFVQCYNTRGVKWIHLQGILRLLATSRWSIRWSSRRFSFESILGQNQCWDKVYRMNITFQDFAVSQIKAFLYSSYGATARTICYAYHAFFVSPSLGPYPVSIEAWCYLGPHLTHGIPYSLKTSLLESDSLHTWPSSRNPSASSWLAQRLG